MMEPGTPGSAPRPVVAGIDGSEGSAAVVRYAATEARRTGSGLLLVHVIPDYLILSPMLPVAPTELEGMARAIVERAAEAASETLAPARISTKLVNGSRTSCLVRAGDGASQIVLGREARSNVQRVVTGATTIGVAARAACPTIAVPPDWVAGPAAARVVAGIKTSAHSESLLQHSFLAAKRLGAELSLVHAWEIPSGYDDVIAGRVAREEWADALRRELGQPLAAWQAAFPEVTVHLEVVHGQAARVLRDASADADLVLLTRRMHGFPGGHLGGTGRLLLREAACPVEVVPLGAGAGFDPDFVLERDGALLR